MKPLTSHNNVTHWAEYIFQSYGGLWKRIAVWRLEGVSDDGTIFHFRSMNGVRTMWQPASLMATRGFRPFVYLGGRR